MGLIQMKMQNNIDRKNSTDSSKSIEVSMDDIVSSY